MYDAVPFGLAGTMAIPWDESVPNPHEKGPGLDNRLRG